MDKNILEIKTVQASAFRILVEALKEILTDAKRTALEDGERHLATDASEQIKHQIRESIMNINQHDSNRSEVVIKYCKNIGLKRYFDSLMVDPEKQSAAMKVFNS